MEQKSQVSGIWRHYCLSFAHYWGFPLSRKSTVKLYDQALVTLDSDLKLLA